MSDSEWEVLPPDPDHRPHLHGGSHSGRSCLAGINAATAACDGHGSTAASSPNAVGLLPPISKIVTPLCIAVNQTSTRIGVGHSTGYLVFQVVEAEEEESRGSTAAAGAKWTPEGPRLCLDHRYNLDMATFTRIQRRMERRNASKQRMATASQTNTAAPLEEMEEDIVALEDDSIIARPVAGVSPRVTAKDGDQDDDDSTSDESAMDGVLGSDLHSFLSSAQRSRVNGRRKGPARAMQPTASSASTTTTTSRTQTAQAAEPVLRWDDDDDGDGDDYQDDQKTPGEKNCLSVGYGCGGVAVMSLLYQQTWVAVVGGGPTPLDRPNVVHLIHDGEKCNKICVESPVVRLFFDARLLFILTTDALKIYSNPTEADWTVCRQTIHLSNSGTSILTPPPPLRSCGTAVLERQNAKPPPEKAAPMSPTGVAEETTIPTIPITIDYTRSLLLMPAPGSPCGFALYRFETGPEPVHASTTVAATTAMAMTASASSSGAIEIAGNPQLSSVAGASLSDNLTSTILSRRTTVHLSPVAVVTVAHQNPLQSLAMYVGWAESDNRLVDNDSSSELTLPSCTHGLSSEVTLVAACSTFATRITLWMLLPTAPNELAAPTSTATRSASGALSFVLLREYRVGVRVAAPASALPAIAKLLTQYRSVAGGFAAEDLISYPNGSSSSFGKTARGRNSPSSNNEEEETGTGAPLAQQTSSGSLLGDLSHHFSAGSGGLLSSLFSSSSGSGSAAAPVGTSTIRHLSFLHHGKYLFCVDGHDVMRVFCTNAPEAESELQNMCISRQAAEQNRYSRLQLMRHLLPQSLSTQLEAYTRQAWSSCSAKLPTQDPQLIPRWLYIRGQESMAAESAAMAASTSSTSSLLQQQQQQPIRDQFMHRFRTFMTRQRQPSAQPVVVDRRPSWGTPLSHLSECLCVWELPPLPLEGGASSISFGHFADPNGTRRDPGGEAATGVETWRPLPTQAATIVLRCATTDGALMSIFLFAEEGRLVCSRAVPCKVVRPLNL